MTPKETATIIDRSETTSVNKAPRANRPSVAGYRSFTRVQKGNGLPTAARQASCASATANLGGGPPKSRAVGSFHNPQRA